MTNSATPCLLIHPSWPFLSFVSLRTSTKYFITEVMFPTSPMIKYHQGEHDPRYGRSITLCNSATARALLLCPALHFLQASDFHGVAVMSHSEGGWADVDKQSALGDILWLRPDVHWDGREDKRSPSQSQPDASSSSTCDDVWLGWNSPRVTFNANGSNARAGIHFPVARGYPSNHSVSLHSSGTEAVSPSKRWSRPVPFWGSRLRTHPRKFNSPSSWTSSTKAVRHTLHVSAAYLLRASSGQTLSLAKITDPVC